MKELSICLNCLKVLESITSFSHFDISISISLRDILTYLGCHGILLTYLGCLGILWRIVIDDFINVQSWFYFQLVTEFEPRELSFVNMP